MPSAAVIVVVAHRLWTNEARQRAKTARGIAQGFMKRSLQRLVPADVVRQETDSAPSTIAEPLLRTNTKSSEPSPGSLTDILSRLERCDAASDQSHSRNA
jgi:hypothetical protein